MKCSQCHKDTKIFILAVVGVTDDGLPMEEVVCGDCGTPEYIVDPTGEAGTYPTIQAALDAANAEGRGRITLRPGAYDGENVTP